jgi:hypothetical protein
MEPEDILHPKRLDSSAVPGPEYLKTWPKIDFMISSD